MCQFFQRNRKLGLNIISTDFFAQKAFSYDQNKSRIDNVENIANTILKNTPLQKYMHLMDFGSGTGLLLERIAAYVRKITAVDISKSMNDQLINKRSAIGCEIEIRQIDLEIEEITGIFDGIISSKTLHHIKKIDAIFRKFYTLLKTGGFIAISDLDNEDGSFHTEDTGVYHFGFERKDLITKAMEAGFLQVKIIDASIVQKPQGNFQVFLLIAKK